MNRPSTSQDHDYALPVRENRRASDHSFADVDFHLAVNPPSTSADYAYTFPVPDTIRKSDHTYANVDDGPGHSDTLLTPDVIEPDYTTALFQCPLCGRTYSQKSTFKRHLKRNRCDRKKRKCDARAVEVEQLLSKRRKQVGIRCTLYHFMQGWLRLN